jgi:hypothetical protein
MVVAMSDTFSAEEYGTGSRLTPLVDAPAWLKAKASRDAGEGDRATLTPYDRAFLESVPTYENEEGVSLPPPAAVVPVPSTARRVFSLLLFVAIAGSASAVLGLAVLRMLGRALPW